VLSKDDIKETLMDNLAWTDRESSKAIGKAAIDMLFRWIEVEITARRSLIAEMNFHTALILQDSSPSARACRAASCRCTARRLKTF